MEGVSPILNQLTLRVRHISQPRFGVNSLTGFPLKNKQINHLYFDVMHPWRHSAINGILQVVQIYMILSKES